MPCAQHAHERFRRLAFEGRQRGYAVIHLALVDIRPRPRTVNGHGGVALVERAFRDGVIGVGVHVFIFDKLNQEVQARFRARAVHADVFHIIFAVFKLKRVTAVRLR